MPTRSKRSFVGYFRLLTVFVIILSSTLTNISPAKAAGISISGTVFYSSTPYPGVSITLYSMPSWTVLQTTTSDARGFYSFSGVASGNVMVFLNAPTNDFLSTGYGSVVGSTNVIWNLFLIKKIYLNSPGNGSVVFSYSPRFCWTGLPESTKYTFQLNRQSDWALIDFVHEITSTCFTTSKRLQPGETYSWQIDALDSNNHGVGGTYQEFTFTLPQCISNNTKFDVCLLQRGDVLFSLGDVHLYPIEYQAARMLGGTYWFHSALYLGDGRVAEATGPAPYVTNPADQVKVSNLSDTGWWIGEITDWAVIRPVATTALRDQAAAYAEGKANQVSPDVLYNTAFTDKQSEDKFYCSQLVWKAYQKQGLDLEVNVGILSTIAGFLQVVTPDDLFYSISNGKSFLVEAKPSSNQIWRAVFRILSPGHLLLTDPQGRRTGLDPVSQIVLNEIPNTYYMAPGEGPESIIVLYPILEKDNWVLTVTGTASGEYTLSSELMANGYLFSSNAVQSQTTLGQTDTYPLITSGLVPLIRQVFLPALSR